MVDKERALYRILDPVGFFDDNDTLHMPSPDGDYPEVYFDGIPNEQMEPLNEVAKDRLNKYLEELDRKGREAAEKLGRPFTGRPRNLDGAIMLATEMERSKISIMGSKDKVGTTERHIPDNVSEQGKRRGRPRKVA